MHVAADGSQFHLDCCTQPEYCDVVHVQPAVGCSRPDMEVLSLDKTCWRVQEKDAAARKEQRRKERSAMATMDVQMQAAEARKAVRFLVDLLAMVQRHGCCHAA